MADPDFAHFNVASLITSTDRQISKEAAFFKDVENVRLIYRSIGDKFPDPATFSKEALYNIRTGLRYRYESTAIKEEDAIYHNRVSALGIVLFFVIIPLFDRRKVSSMSDYMWFSLIQCLSLRFEGKQPPGEDFVIRYGRSKDPGAVLYRKPNVADQIRKELEAERIKYPFKKRLEQDTARIESAAATEVTKATQQIRERCKKDLEEARALLTEEFREQLEEAAKLERAYKKPTNTSPANISRSLSEPKADVIAVTPQGDGGGSDHMLQAGQAEVSGIGCRQTKDDPSVPKSLNTTAVHETPSVSKTSSTNTSRNLNNVDYSGDAGTKSSNSLPANPSQILKEDNVNSSLGNSPQPNNDGIGWSVPPATRQKGGCESWGVKRKFGATSPPTPQRTQPSNVSPLLEPIPRIDPPSAMSFTPNTGSVRECAKSIIRYAMELDALLAGRYPGDEGRSGQMCEGGRVGALELPQKAAHSHKAKRYRTSSAPQTEDLKTHPSLSEDPQSRNECNVDSLLGNNGRIAQLRPVTSRTTAVTSREDIIKQHMAVSNFVNPLKGVNFLNFKVSPREFCSVLQYITESRTYRAVRPRNRPDGPIYIDSRKQGFSLLFVQEPPGALEAKPGQEVKGDTLCKFFDSLWEPEQLDDTNLLIFEGSSEAVEETGDSTHAALFFTTEFKDEVVFTCEDTMYGSILWHVYTLRAI